MKLKWKQIGATIAAVATTLVAASNLRAAEPERTKVNITVFTGNLVSLIEQFAVHGGFLEKEGLEGTLVQSTNGPAMLASVIGGSSDITVASPLFTWDLHNKGECLSYFMNGVGGFYSLIARNDVDLPNLGKGYPESIRDLKGKRIGVVGRGTATELWAAMVLREAGLDPDKDVTFVATGGVATAATAFENNLVDVQFAIPPLEEKLVAGSFKVVANLYDGDVPTLKGLLQTGTMTSCAFKQQNPETFKRACRALHAAYDYAVDPKNAAAMGKEVAAVLGVSDELGKKMWDKYSPAFTGPELTKESWVAQAKYIVRDGMQSVPPPYEDMVDTTCDN